MYAHYIVKYMNRSKNNKQNQNKPCNLEQFCRHSSAYQQKLDAAEEGGFLPFLQPREKVFEKSSCIKRIQHIKEMSIPSPLSYRHDHLARYPAQFLCP